MTSPLPEGPLPDIPAGESPLPQRPPPAGGLSLSRRLYLTSTVIAAVVLVTSAVAGWAYYRQVQASNHLVNVVDQERLDAQSLLSDYVNEETGVRGYILSGQVSFLQPYVGGVAAAATDRRRLAALERRDPSAQALLRAVDAAAQQWTAHFAVPAISATAASNSAFATQAQLAAGKAEFDTVRQRFAALNGALTRSAAASTATLRQSRHIFVGVLAMVLLTTLACGLGAARALRSWVTRPLGRLRADVAEVAAGHLERPVSASGPPDLVEVAQDVELMRRRILNEVHVLAEASEELRALNAELARSNLELEQFAYVASHDLQEPLRKVVSFCDLLRRRYGEQLDERAQTYIDYAVDGATRMQALINDLLAFSRVGRTTDEFVDVPLGEVFAHAVSNLETVIKEKGADVTAGPLPTVKGDAALLTTLFQNLIANAIKFNQGPRPWVRVVAEKDGEDWQIQVTDNGIGVEPRFAERIFVIFQRLHGRDEYSGTGIGLALCRKIVEFHGGRIWLDTSYSPGTRMCLSLPVVGEAPLSVPSALPATGDM